MTATARLLAKDLGRSPSPFTMSHTPAYSSHCFIVEPNRNERFILRQYARGPALEESISMLDSTFRGKTNQAHCDKASQAHCGRTNRTRCGRTNQAHCGRRT